MTHTVVSISGTRHNPRKQLPPAADLAQMVRDGETPADLAHVFNCGARTIQERLNDAGYNANTGQRWADTKKPTVEATIHRLFDPQPWSDRASCAEVDADMWFPEKEGDGRAVPSRYIAEAKSVCRRCDVRVQCLTYALENNEQYGIWGGLTPTERERVRKGLPAEKICALDGCGKPVNRTTTAVYCSPICGARGRRARIEAEQAS